MGGGVKNAVFTGDACDAMDVEDVRDVEDGKLDVAFTGGPDVEDARDTEDEELAMVCTSGAGPVGGPPTWEFGVA